MSLRVLDLFSGCGGLSLGLSQAGHEIIAACERDRWAGDTYERNHPKALLIREDITKVEAGWWAQQFKGEIDLIAGGPPCQGFSVSGKRQHGHVLAQNQLVKQFLQVVEEVRPRFVLIENVSGFRTGKLNGKERVFEFVMNSLAAQGFECQ